MAFLIGDIVGNDIFVISGAHFTESFQDQDDWNWSELHRRTKHKRFRWLMDFSDPTLQKRLEQIP